MMRCQRAQALFGSLSPHSKRLLPIASTIPVRRVPATQVRTFFNTPISHSRSAFKYHFAAAYSAKDARFDLSKDYFNYDPEQETISRSSSNGVNKTARKNRLNSGQDAFFISNIGHDDRGVAFGVVSVAITQSPFGKQ